MSHAGAWKDYIAIGHRPRHRLNAAVFVCCGCSTIMIGLASLQSHGCTCSALPACHAWSCDAPLANGLHDEWPSWPPAAGPERQLPRDNLLTPEAEARWLALHRQHAAAAAKATSATKVAFLGDSLTEGWVRSGFSGRVASVAQPRCEAIWRETFGHFNPLNLAIGGDRVQDLGWRLQRGLLPSSLTPPVFFVLMGTNDLGSGEHWHVVADELELVLEQARIDADRTHRFHRLDQAFSPTDDVYVSRAFDHRPAARAKAASYRGAARFAATWRRRRPHADGGAAGRALALVGSPGEQLPPWDHFAQRADAGVCKQPHAQALATLY